MPPHIPLPSVGLALVFRLCWCSYPSISSCSRILPGALTVATCRKSAMYLLLLLKRTSVPVSDIPFIKFTNRWSDSCWSRPAPARCGISHRLGLRVTSRSRSGTAHSALSTQSCNTQGRSSSLGCNDCPSTGKTCTGILQGYAFPHSQSALPAGGSIRHTMQSALPCRDPYDKCSVSIKDWWSRTEALGIIF